MPEVNPDFIFAVGHSSAGSMALLFAEHEPRLAGCIAYAPCHNVMKRFNDIIGIRGLSLFLPGVVAFSVKISPETHESNIKCPVFLFHAVDDQQTEYDASKAAAVRLAALDKNITFVTADSYGHYDSMLYEGIPKGIQWLNSICFGAR